MILGIIDWVFYSPKSMNTDFLKDSPDNLNFYFPDQAFMSILAFFFSLFFWWSMMTHNTLVFPKQHIEQRLNQGVANIRIFKFFRIFSFIIPLHHIHITFYTNIFVHSFVLFFWHKYILYIHSFFSFYEYIFRYSFTLFFIQIYLNNKCKCAKNPKQNWLKLFSHSHTC